MTNAQPVMLNPLPFVNSVKHLLFWTSVNESIILIRKGITKVPYNCHSERSEESRSAFASAPLRNRFVPPADILKGLRNSGFIYV